ALDIGLATQPALGADLAGHTGHFVRKRAELVHHDVDGVLDLQDLAVDIDGDLLRQVAVGDGGGHLGDVAQLHGQVAGHEVAAIGPFPPRSRHALDIGLATELAFRAHFASDAGHFGGEGAQLVHHGVDGVFQFEDFAFDIDGNLLGEVAVGHGRGHLGN